MNWAKQNITRCSETSMLSLDVFAEILVEAKRPDLAVSYDVHNLPLVKWYYRRSPRDIIDYLATHDMAIIVARLKPTNDDYLVESVIHQVAPDTLRLIISNGAKIPIMAARMFLPVPDELNHDSLRFERVVRLLSATNVLLTSNVADLAGRVGNLELLKELRRNHVIISTNTMYEAAAGGHLPIVHYLRAMGFAFDQRVAHVATRYGHLEIVKEYNVRRPNDLTIIEVAARYNQITIIDYELSRGLYITSAAAHWLIVNKQNNLVKLYNQHKKLPINREFIESSAAVGNLELLKYGCKQLFNYLLGERARTLGGGGIAEFELSRSVPTITNNDAIRLGQLTGINDTAYLTELVVMLRKAMESAAQHGHAEVVNFIHRELGIDYTRTTMENAARAGLFALTMVIHRQLGGHYSASVINDAVRHGIDLVRYLANRLVGTIDPRAVYNAAMAGQMDVVAFLLPSVPMPNKTLLDLAFNGRLNEVSKLLKLVAFDVDTIRQALIESLKGGHIELVKLLYEKATIDEQVAYSNALYTDEPRLIATLEQLGLPMPPTLLEEAALNNRYKIVRYLLPRYKPSQELVDKVITAGYLSVAELLIRNGTLFSPGLRPNNIEAIKFIDIVIRLVASGEICVMKH